MARVALLFCLTLLWSRAAGVCLKDCYLTSENFSYTCEKIHTASRYTFHIPDGVPRECLKRCEHGWYRKNNTFLVDSKEPHVGSLSEPIVEVTPWNLTTDICLDGPYWKMDCHCLGKAKFVYSYIVNLTDVDMEKDKREANSDNGTSHFLWLLTIPVLTMLAQCC